jgi:hypothetical protein
MFVQLIIKLIHWLVFLFIILTPFFGNERLLSMHLLIVPFIMLHWATNQSICALTEMEKMVTGATHDDDTFFGKVVGPVYKFKTQREENLFVWTAMTTLWVVTLVRLQDAGFAHLRAAWPL